MADAIFINTASLGDVTTRQEYQLSGDLAWENGWVGNGRLLTAQYAHSGLGLQVAKYRERFSVIMPAWTRIS